MDSVPHRRTGCPPGAFLVASAGVDAFNEAHVEAFA